MDHPIMQPSYEGTAAFMSPEMGQRPFDAYAADLWAAAVSLFVFVFGRLPFGHDHINEVTHHIRTQPLVFPESASTAASAELRALLTAMLAKDPSARPGIHKVV